MPGGQTWQREISSLLRLAGREEGKGTSGERNSENKSSEAGVSAKSTSRTVAGEARVSGWEADARPPSPLHHQPRRPLSSPLRHLTTTNGDLDRQIPPRDAGQEEE